MMDESDPHVHPAARLWRMYISPVEYDPAYVHPAVIDISLYFPCVLFF